MPVLFVRAICSGIVTESYVIEKFVNALPREYDIKKQMLEEEGGGFSCETVVSSVQKWFESFAYKQLCRSHPYSADNQAFAITDEGRNRSGRGKSRHSSRKPGEPQGGRGNGGSGRGRGNGGSGGGGFLGEAASSDSSSAATAKSGARTCWVCKSDQHYVRDCPKHICQGCGERGHYITKCGKTEKAAMTVDILGRTSTDDDSPVCSKAEVEAYTTLEIKICKCLEEVKIRQMGNDLWLLNILVTLLMILDYLRIMLSAVGYYVVREVTLARSW